MTKKLFAIDMDGTLLTKSETISDQTKQILKEATDKGHVVCLITGRTLNMAKKLHEESGLTTPIGLFNGAVILSRYDKDFVPTENKLDKEFVKKVLDNELLNEMSSGITVETMDIAYTDNLDTPNTKLQLDWTGKMPTLYKSIDDIKEDIFVILAELKTGDENVAQKIMEEIKTDNEETDVTHWFSGHTQRYMLEISSRVSRKDFALAKLAEYFNIDMKDTVAFGDGGNDTHMLMAAGIGFAMKNAGDEVKSFADKITEFTNDEDGVAKEIMKIIS